MKLFGRAYHRFTAAAPPRLATRLDGLRFENFAAPPLNGQLRRQEIVRELAARVRFDEVIETGTFRAASTLFFRHVTGLPVHSVELLPRYHEFARRRCETDPAIALRIGDSRDFLSQLAPTLGKHTSFFYLDAHWEPDTPRFEELLIISGGWRRAVVMIDDFAVPDDHGYGFASYDGQPLTLDYLPPLPGWAAFFPAARSGEETGAKRGCVVLASPELIQAVAATVGLRRQITSRSDAEDRANPVRADR